MRWTGINSIMLHVHVSCDEILDYKDLLFTSTEWLFYNVEVILHCIVKYITTVYIILYCI